jgi:hypothetical protein
MSAPALHIVKPIEGRAYAFLDCVSYSEEQRLRFDYERCGLLEEVFDALMRLYVVLDDDEGSS